MTYSSPIASSSASLRVDRSTAISVTLDRVAWIASVAVSALLFALLANRHWVPGGDSEVYLATARNLLLHHFSLKRGYIFNGQPMNMVPPGWPYVLALAMTYSTRFAFLKLITLLSMVGTLALAYPVCRRFVPPVPAAGIIVLTALLSHVFPLTFWLHSDALFCLVGTASFLLALQIGEGRGGGFTGVLRIVLLCVLCAAAVTVRWAGVLNWIVVAGALVNRRGLGLYTKQPKAAEHGTAQSDTSVSWREWLKREVCALSFLALVLSGFSTAGTFFLWRTLLAVTPQQATAIREAGGAEETGMDTRADAMTSKAYDLFNADAAGFKGYIGRVLCWGDWFSFLFWQPFRFHAIKWLNTVSTLVGWLVILPLIFLVITSVARGQFLWPAVAVYGFLLAMTWPHPNARYLVPIAFLLLAGIWAGSAEIATRWPQFEGLLRMAIVLFVSSYVLCNGALYGVEVWAQRSQDFYATYEAGLNQDLISASHWLINHHVPWNEAIACSERYVNLSTSARTSKLGLRVTTMLTGRPIITIPKKYMKGRLAATQPTTGPAVYVATTDPDYIFDPDPENNPFFLQWARAQSIRYYLYQPPVSPWRALHFRVAWLEERATHRPAVDTGAGWRLYKIPPTGTHAIRVLPLPPVGDWPLSVPGI